MKKLMIALFTLGSVANTFSQDVLFETKLPKEKVPTIIIESVKEDFPDLVYQEFKSIPIKYVENDVVIANNKETGEDYDTYVITLTGKNKKITATYDKSGKLISTEEFSKKEVLPIDISESLAKLYPGWTVSNDVYKMTHYTGKNEKERYKVTLVKGMEKIKIFTDANGNVLNNSREHKMMQKNS